MKFLLLSVFITTLFSGLVWSATIVEQETEDPHEIAAEVHFGFETENGQHRSENIKYKVNVRKTDEDNETVTKPVEYRGGYSFISADGYEYTVLYKANKNGFQPYVTAHKIKKAE